MATGGKMERARETIRAGLDRVARGAAFDVVFFRDAPRPLWPELREIEPGAASQALAAIDAQKALTYSRTDLLRAVRSALALPGADTVIVVTDGVPTLGVTDEDEFLGAVARANRGVRARIHSVLLAPGGGALAEPAAAPGPDERPEERLMRRLALDNGGVFIKN
jgi:hypothetical protein